ncbi:MAG: hypothetical protein WEE89_07695 [Gemmatimonadota bacterium]
MRVLVVAVVVAFAGLAEASDPVGQTVWVNLNERGVMDRLQASDPERFGQILSILGLAESAPGESFERLIKARFNASAGSVSPLLLTTHPPQRDFRFTLDSTLYTGRLNLGLRHEIERAFMAQWPLVGADKPRKGVLDLGR